MSVISSGCTLRACLKPNTIRIRLKEAALDYLLAPQLVDPLPGYRIVPVLDPGQGARDACSGVGVGAQVYDCEVVSRSLKFLAWRGFPACSHAETHALSDEYLPGMQGWVAEAFRPIASRRFEQAFALAASTHTGGGFGLR